MKDRFNWTYFVLVLPPLFWAGNAILARFVADLVPPVTMSFWRWVLALAILLPFTWKSVLRDWDKIKKSWKIILFLGLLGIASFNTLLYTAAKTTTAINISLTQSVMPVIIVMINLVLFREQITLKQLLAIVLCTLGAGYIVIHGQLQRLLDLEFVSGDLIMLLAITLYGLYSALLRRRPDIHPLSFLTTTFAVGVIFLFPLYLFEARSVPPLMLSQPVVLSLLYVAFFPSIVAYLCWNRGVYEIGANRAGLYINLIPLFTALLAVVLLGERFLPYHVSGIVLIFAGLLLFNLPVGRKKGAVK